MTEARVEVPTNMQASIAVDLGAESCRVSLLRLVGGELKYEVIHRFPNGPVRADDGSLRWPLQQILAGVDFGVQRCAELAPEGVRSLAVDGWAVDYVRLDREGQVLEEPYSYRDERNVSAAHVLHQHVAPGLLRRITKIEQQPLNTLYQLYADQLQGRPPAIWVNLPEYLLHRWGAERVAEYTNASHTQLVDSLAEDWSREIFEGAGLDLTRAPRIVPPGTLLGTLTGPLAELPGLSNTELIAPACHDTASAIAGIAETEGDWAYISCGTWSLVGTLLAGPLDSAAIRADNFTNLGAVGGRTCFHKSINGMWILKQCMDGWAAAGKPWSLVELLAAAEMEPTPSDLLQVDDLQLMSMGDMPRRINAQLISRNCQPISEESPHAPRMIGLVLHSLASRYAEVIDRLRIHSGKAIRRIIMVGGGAQNTLLRRLTAEHTGLEVIVGPAESSTVGNFAVQLAALESGPVSDSADFAKCVSKWASLLSPR